MNLDLTLRTYQIFTVKTLPGGFLKKCNESISRLGNQAVTNRTFSLAPFSGISPKHEGKVGGSSRSLELGFPTK